MQKLMETDRIIKRDYAFFSKFPKSLLYKWEQLVVHAYVTYSELSLHAEKCN